mgnify:CR=1 FL=1
MGEPIIQVQNISKQYHIGALERPNRTLREALTDALASTAERHEIIIVDDGSQDGTRDILEDVTGRDARVRTVFNTENVGEASTKGVEVENLLQVSERVLLGFSLTRLEAKFGVLEDPRLGYLNRFSDTTGALASDDPLFEGLDFSLGEPVRVRGDMSDAEVAQAIAQEIAAQGRAADVRRVEDDPDSSAYGAVVVGSAVRFGKWLPKATKFVWNPYIVG